MIDQVYYDRDAKKWKAKPGTITLRAGNVQRTIALTRLKQHLSEGIRVGITIGKHLRGK
jgi:hypothetical protein